jgi:hypothetical protein
LGVTTAHGTTEYRKDNDYRLIPVKREYKNGNPGLKTRGNGVISRDYDYVYGIPTPPEKDMKQIMQGDFGRRWLEEHQDRSPSLDGFRALPGVRSKVFFL